MSRPVFDAINKEREEIGDALIAEMVNGPVNVKLEVPANLYLYADAIFTWNSNTIKIKIYRI